MPGKPLVGGDRVEVEAPAECSSCVAGTPTTWSAAFWKLSQQALSPEEGLLGSITSEAQEGAARNYKELSRIPRNVLRLYYEFNRI